MLAKRWGARLAMALVCAPAWSIEPVHVLSMADDAAERPAVVTALDISPDGSRVAAGGDDHLLRLWDAATGRRVATLEGHEDWVRSARFDPSGDRLASASHDHTVRLWTRDGVLAGGRPLPAGGALAAVSIDSKGERLATVGFGDALRLWRLDSSEAPIKRRCPCEDTRTVVFSPDGRWLAAGGRNGLVRLWDLTASGGPRDLPGDGRRVRAMAFSPAGDTLAVGGDGPVVRLWRLGDAGLLGEGIPQAPEELITRPGKTHSLAFVGERVLAVGGTMNSVQLWDTQNRSKLRSLEGHTGTVAALASTPSGRLLVSGSFDTTVRVWSIDDPLDARTAIVPKRNDKTR